MSRLRSAFWTLVTVGVILLMAALTWWFIKAMALAVLGR